MSLIRNTFKRLHDPVDVIAQCVRWYLVYSLSLRDLEEMIAEWVFMLTTPRFTAELSVWYHCWILCFVGINGR
jgi:hypothetical protein